MINLKVDAKDMDIFLKSHSTMKSFNNEKGKDFVQILETQKNIQKKVETPSIDKETSMEGVKVQEKNTDNQVKPEEPVEEDKDKEEVKEELIVLMNLIYDIATRLQIEPDELEDLSLEPLKLEAEELSSKLAEFLQEDNLSLNEEDMANIVEDFGELISSFEKELDKLNVSLKEETMDLPEEITTKLDEITDTVKSLEDSINQLKENEDVNLKDEEKPLDVDENKQDMEIEFEKVYDEEKTVSREDEPTVDNTGVEEIQVEEVDNNPQYQIMDKFKTEENKGIENKDLPKVDKKEVFEQIVDKAKLILEDNKQEIKVKLKPEILGELMLRMEVEKGSVLAKVIVDNYKTKELIEANLYQLKQEMKENGLEIKTFEVFVGSNKDFEKENRQEFNFSQKRKKMKIRNEKLKGIETYDESIKESMTSLYEEGGLNLFA